MRFLLGLLTGAFTVLCLTRIPHYIRFDDMPQTPLDWTPKMYTYRNGKRLDDA